MSSQPDWHFVGSVPENYERYLVPSIFGPFADDLIEIAALQENERVLDIACGTGIVARTAARRAGRLGRVVGLDSSAPMLEAARSAAAREGVSAEWREGSAMNLPFPDGAFDVVLCQQGLQFFPDRQMALQEMRRVLTPGGRLGLSVWGSIERSPGFAVLANALTRHISPQAGALLTNGPFSLSDAEELRALVASANFDDITIRPALKMLCYPSPDEFVRHYAAGSALAGSVASADDRGRAALLADVKGGLQAYVDDRLAFPIETNVVRAHK